MATGLLAPDARLRVLSDLGLISAGAKLHTYVAGTPSTPLATYSDVALTIPNANPVIASAGSLFGPVYLTPGVSYKFVLTDALDNPIWSQDNIPTPLNLSVAALTNHGVALGTGTEALASTAAGTAGQVLTSNGASADPTFQYGASLGINDFRLTLSAGIPVTTSDVTGASAVTIYCSPYIGNRITLYNASGVPTVLTSAEFSIGVPAPTNQMYDVFAYSNAGVATLELLAWTNDTTRATALVRTTTGVLTKSGDLTRRYLGSFRTTGVANQTIDSVTTRHLWNYYNRVRRDLFVVDATASWVYNTAAWRQARGSTANQVDVVVGWREVLIDLTAVAVAQNDVADAVVATGIGEDVTNAHIVQTAGGQFRAPLAAMKDAGVVKVSVLPPVGRHFYAWLEFGPAVNNTSWFGSPSLTGLIGWIEG